MIQKLIENLIMTKSLNR